MTLERLDHFNVATARPEETLNFYCNALGLVNRPDLRPDFPVPGAWLFAGDNAVVHVVYVDEEPGEPSGPVDHVAFAGSDQDEICAQLDELGIEYSTLDHPSGAFSQVFVHDPNGVKIEINISTRHA